ncbi:response regulator [Pseudomonas turukhanskensis]|uniref:Response regulatory domain-containing protein n=1 Tax=Pseudomonas turukhanskensis TaxID=1806536 RepID=A0A9W6K889_9PSED|nr:hypothetical protein GCM10017655_30650 [Pseudomonas turukhanskensis]
MPSKILVVEDDDTLRYLIADAMSLLDLEVTCCGTADEAIALLENASPFALVMTDIRMPGHLNGWDLMNLIQLRWPSLPIIVSSGHRRVRSSELPPKVVFLAKPWDLNRLLSAVENALSQQAKVG